MTRDPARLRLASRAWMPLGRRVAIVGGGLVGVELAEFLADRGRDVMVLEEGPILATEMAHPRRWRVLFDLREAGVTLLTGTRVLEIGESTVRIESTGATPEAPPSVSEISADTVLLATGLEPEPRTHRRPAPRRRPRRRRRRRPGRRLHRRRDPRRLPRRPEHLTPRPGQASSKETVTSNDWVATPPLRSSTSISTGNSPAWFDAATR